MGILFWFGTFFFVLVLLGFLVLWFGLLFFVRYTNLNPQYTGVWHEDNGDVRETRPIKGINDDWKMLGSKPGVVKLRMITGLFFSQEIEWALHDFVEIKFAKSGRKIIHFNLKGYNRSLHRNTERLVEERNHYFNKWFEQKMINDELVKEGRLPIKQLKEDHKDLNKSGPIIHRGQK